MGMYYEQSKVAFRLRRFGGPIGKPISCRAVVILRAVEELMSTSISNLGSGHRSIYLVNILFLQAPCRHFRQGCSCVTSSKLIRIIGRFQAYYVTSC